MRPSPHLPSWTLPKGMMIKVTHGRKSHQKGETEGGGKKRRKGKKKETTKTGEKNEKMKLTDGRRKGNEINMLIGLQHPPNNTTTKRQDQRERQHLATPSSCTQGCSQFSAAAILRAHPRTDFLRPVYSDATATANANKNDNSARLLTRTGSTRYPGSNQSL